MALSTMCLNLGVLGDRPDIDLRKDETEWCKYQQVKSKRHSMVHILEVQHLKEQNAKGLQPLALPIFTAS